MLGRILKRTFRFWERLGFHVTPSDFSEPTPDTRTLPDALWAKHSELVGIDIRESSQLELLSVFASRYRGEYDAFPRKRTTAPHQYFVDNQFFESVDGEILYCMIRHFRPRRIIEIGSGYSTLLTAQALLRNGQDDDGYSCELIAVEPHPGPSLRAGFPGLSRLIAKNVQDVPLSEFDRLTANDILFIDSTHVLRIGGDVQYEYLEVLPRLRKGVLVHVHDIFLPAEYPKDWVLRLHRFWTEQYLLQAFLTFNESFEVLWAGSWMHLRHPDKLEAAFSSYSRDERWPGSFWMRKTK